MIGYVLQMVFPIAMAFAATNDLFTMRIPNKISIALVAAFAITAFYIRVPIDQVMIYTAVGAIFLAAGFALFSFNLLGGGDAKLLAAGALWMGPEFSLHYIVYVTIFGGLLALLILAYRQFVPVTALPLPAWAVKLHAKGGGIPYGIAIALSGLVMYPSTIWYQALVS